MLDEYLKVLGLDRSTSITKIVSVYKRLRSKAHPDKGGSKEVFTKLKDAYEWLLENFEEEIEIISRPIYTSSLDDRIKSQTKIFSENRTFTSFDDPAINFWEQRENVEFDESLVDQRLFNGEFGSGFAGFNGDGTVSYKFQLHQLLGGGSALIKVPNFHPTTIKIEPNTLPNSVITVSLLGAASWLPSSKDVKLKVLLEPHQIYALNGIHLSATIRVSMFDVLEQKQIILPHPAKVQVLSGAPIPLAINLPSTVGAQPIVFKNLGFDTIREVGDLFVYTIVDFPRANKSMADKVKEILL
jgi:DnaJ-class molecular chaperone